MEKAGGGTLMCEREGRRGGWGTQTCLRGGTGRLPQSQLGRLYKNRISTPQRPDCIWIHQVWGRCRNLVS